MAHTITFYEDHGVHQFETSAGENVTAISQPDWPRFVRSLGELATTGAAGTFVLTPELMTAGDILPTELRGHRGVIAERIAEASAISRRLPDTTILLGSLAFDPDVEKPRNVLYFLRGGELTGRTIKRSPVAKTERDFLQEATSHDDLNWPAPNVQAVICSDLFEYDAGAETGTLLVGACWGVPAGYGDSPYQPRDAQKEFLHDWTGELFERNERLHTIIMADRAPQATPAARPYNFIAVRQLLGS